jgi:hypothetical protein
MGAGRQAKRGRAILWGGGRLPAAERLRERFGTGAGIAQIRQEPSQIAVLQPPPEGIWGMPRSF